MAASEEDIVAAVDKLDTIYDQFDHKKIRDHALTFDESVFREKIMSFLKEQNLPVEWTMELSTS